MSTTNLEVTTSQSCPISSFHSYATTGLSVLAGLLIGLPFIEQQPLVFFLSGAMGGVVGFRWRRSRFFMYLAAITVLIISGIVMSNGFPAPPLDQGQALSQN
jgi:uncharacterized membrane protein YccC